MSTTIRTGVSLLEVLIALVILVLAASVLLQSGGSIHKRSTLNEFHALAAIRARTLASFLSAMEFERLRARLGTDPSPQFSPLDVEALFEPGELAFVFAAPGRENPLYVEKLKNFSQEVRGRVAERDLVELEIVVRWSVPAERRSEPHEYRLLAALHRPAATMSGTGRR